MPHERAGFDVILSYSVLHEVLIERFHDKVITWYTLEARTSRMLFRSEICGFAVCHQPQYRASEFCMQSREQAGQGKHRDRTTDVSELREPTENVVWGKIKDDSCIPMSMEDGGSKTDLFYDKNFESGLRSVFMFTGKRPMITLEFRQCSGERLVALYVVSWPSYVLREFGLPRPRK